MSWNIFGSVCGEADHDLRYADEVSQFSISGNPIRLAKDKTKNFNLWKMRDLNHIRAKQLSCTEGYPLTCDVCKWRFFLILSWNTIIQKFYVVKLIQKICLVSFFYWVIINEKEKIAVLLQLQCGRKTSHIFLKMRFQMCYSALFV